jgi:hypothetical protein
MVRFWQKRSEGNSEEAAYQCLKRENLAGQKSKRNGDKDMKTVTRIVRGSGLALALITAFMMTGTASGQNRPTGDGITASPRLRAQLDERRASATPVLMTTATMACAKCTDGWVTVSDSTVKGVQVLLGQTTRRVAKHLCDGCGAEWNMAGTGKAKQVVASHKCTGCGAENPACCSGKGSGAVATKGMDQKIQIAPLK